MREISIKECDGANIENMFLCGKSKNRGHIYTSIISKPSSKFLKNPTPTDAEYMTTRKVEVINIDDYQEKLNDQTRENRIERQGSRGR